MTDPVSVEELTAFRDRLNDQIERALNPHGVSLEDPEQQTPEPRDETSSEPELPESAAPEAAGPERVIVKPAPDSRLEGLLCEYEQRKSEAAEAERKFKELKAAIAAELEGLYPDPATRPSKAYEIPATGMFPKLTWQYVEKPYLPASDIKTHLPAIYNAFAKTTSYWELRPESKNRGGKRK